jgi:hypothetical protein
MTKSWEETWEAEKCCDANECCATYLSDDGTEIGRFSGIDDKPFHTARAKLAAAAPEMARLLLELQNVSYPAETYNIDGCPVCRGRVDDGQHVHHEPDCRLVAVLRKAGVLEEKDGLG